MYVPFSFSTSHAASIDRGRGEACIFISHSSTVDHLRGPGAKRSRETARKKEPAPSSPKIWLAEKRPPEKNSKLYNRPSGGFGIRRVDRRHHGFFCVSSCFGRGYNRRESRLLRPRGVLDSPFSLRRRGSRPQPPPPQFLSGLRGRRGRATAPRRADGAIFVRGTERGQKRPGSNRPRSEVVTRRRASSLALNVVTTDAATPMPSLQSFVAAAVRRCADAAILTWVLNAIRCADETLCVVSRRSRSNVRRRSHGGCFRNRPRNHHTLCPIHVRVRDKFSNNIQKTNSWFHHTCFISYLIFMHTSIVFSQGMNPQSKTLYPPPTHIRVSNKVSHMFHILAS